MLNFLQFQFFFIFVTWNIYFIQRFMFVLLLKTSGSFWSITLKMRWIFFLIHFLGFRCCITIFWVFATNFWDSIRGKLLFNIPQDRQQKEVHKGRMGWLHERLNKASFSWMGSISRIHRLDRWPCRSDKTASEREFGWDNGEWIWFHRGRKWKWILAF